MYATRLDFDKVTAVRSSSIPAFGTPPQHNMDAVDDDQDVKLQRASGDLLEDFRSSLKPFLWKTSKSGRAQVIRSQVRARDTERLVNLVCFSVVISFIQIALCHFVHKLIGFSSNPSKNYHSSSTLISINLSRSSQMLSLPPYKPEYTPQQMRNCLCQSRKRYANYSTRSARSEETKSLFDSGVRRRDIWNCF